MIEPGQRVGPYVVEALLGMGGMGAVYRARDERLGRRVALKVVRPDRVDHTGVAPEDRLIAEARAVAALRHPHVVEVYDAGVADGQTYVAMEYVEGKPLRAYVGDSSVPLATRRRWLVEIASALAAAHRTGLIHRDIKPENVLIDGEHADGAARVLDFGLAKRVAHDESAPTVDAPQPETQGGRVVGTVSYMAPEQLAGGPPDPKWDEFSWGLLAYELLTGSHPRLAVPMPGQTAHLTQTPKMPNELVPEIAFSDAAAVMRAMARDPMSRFASMDAVLAAMKNDAPQSIEVKMPPARLPRAPSRRRSPLVFGALLVVSIGALAMGWAVRHEAPSTAAATQSSPPSVAIPPPSAMPAPSISPSPSASAPPAASLAVSGVAATERRVNARPEDYGTACTCASTEDGRLCPRGSDMHRRVCQCTSDDGWSLYQGDSGSQDVTGRDLVDGQTCRGGNGGPEQVGKLKDCVASCNLGTFAGVHRTPCRGLRPRDGAEREGLLLCY